MTQGEEQQQHSGVASAYASLKEPRQPEANNGVESSGTSSFDSSSSVSSVSRGEMEQMPPRYSGTGSQQKTQHPTSSEAGDVRTLLHFVNLASDDIKAALDSSTSTTSTSATRKVDVGQVMTAGHEKLTSQDSHMSLTTSPKSLLSSDKIDTSFDFRFLGNSVAQNTDDNTRGKTCAVAPVSVNVVEKLERDFHETKPFKPDMLIMDVPLKEHLQMSSCGIQGDSKVNLDKSLFDKRGGYGDSAKPHGLISPFCEDKKDGGPRDNPVPLRKRRLPASFWQEPGKSENHKTAPSSSAAGLNFPGNLSPTASHNFKMPMLSPLTLPHGNDSRLGNNPLSEKGFLYPNSGVSNNNNETCCSSNLGLSFHYASSSALPVTPCMDSLQHRSMALSCGSLCSCHLNNMNNSNYFYDHHHNHGLYPRSQGEFSSLLNSAAAAAAAAAAASGTSPTSPLSRSWHHHAQSLHSDSREICHHTLPRVLKPIPTKTMSSYPPRFHPIFT